MALGVSGIWYLYLVYLAFGICSPDETERSQWRPYLYQTLQKALVDVRALKYKENENSWIPSDKQKRKTMGVPEENNETTSNKQKRKAFVEAAEDNIEMVEDVTYLCL